MPFVSHLIWNDLSSSLVRLIDHCAVCRWRTGQVHGTAVEAAITTIDQSDIRGSSQRPANMVMIRRELPRTKIAGRGQRPAA